MIVYALPGSGLQQFGGTCSDGWVQMTEARPGVHFVAMEDGMWVEVGEPVPMSVSRYQGREAMRLTRYQREGSPGRTLFDAFEELLTDPATPSYYRRAWDELQVFDRESAMFNAAADVLGLKQEQRDALFRLGAALKA